MTASSFAKEAKGRRAQQQWASAAETAASLDREHEANSWGGGDEGVARLVTRVVQNPGLASEYIRVLNSEAIDLESLALLDLESFSEFGELKISSHAIFSSLLLASNHSHPPSPLIKA